MAIIPNKLFFFFLLSYLVLFVGCSAKSSQGAIQEAYMPIECNVTIPDKPVFDPLNPESLKDLIIYCIRIEDLLKGCVNGQFKQGR
ncbi:hypothetical protein [Campylobacter concisus]|jgi:putative lipoprotein|uniref:hypothetical protein n=1 Tax=Campylobacter concisus TaxID=199 RepID=UPI00122C9E3C|nr:hypothetical protein [Campylobacter concisus]